MVRVNKRKTVAFLLLLDIIQKRGGKKRRFWVHPRIKRRQQHGDFYHLVAELRLDSKRHHQYFRMSAEQMEELLSFLGPELRKQSTTYRAPIEPKQRLAVGLRYLASGDSLSSLAFSYRLGSSTVTNSVHMLCAAIEKVMTEKYLPTPTEDTWRQVAKAFWEKWNFPNCLGAIDGKYIQIQTPPVSGSQNYERSFSIVLLGLVDADYKFRVIQVGDLENNSNVSVFAGSYLGKGMEARSLHVPPSAPLPGAAHLGDVPFVMVSDAAFPLKPYLMRPYPGQNLRHNKKIFNYRLSRAKMVVENTFSILASRWRIFHRKINLLPKNVETLMVAACILHNFLLAPSENQRMLDDAELLGRSMVSVRNMGGNRASRDACNARETLCSFFNSAEGSLSWQEKMVS